MQKPANLFTSLSRCFLNCTTNLIDSGIRNLLIRIKDKSNLVSIQFAVMEAKRYNDFIYEKADRHIRDTLYYHTKVLDSNLIQH